MLLFFNLILISVLMGGYITFGGIYKNYKYILLTVTFKYIKEMELIIEVALKN